MKRCLVVLVGILVFSLAGFASAIATQNCTVFPASFTSGVGSQTVNCMSFAQAWTAAGLGASVPGTVTETGITLEFWADYQFGNVPGTNEVQVNFTPSGPMTWATAIQTIDVLGAFQSSSDSPPVPYADNALTFTSLSGTFTVGVISSLIQGGVTTSSGGVQVIYSYTNSAVPEPATISLIGGALLGLGVVLRRKKRA